MRVSPSHIMCAVDFSGFAPGVLSYGAALAREYEAKLSACHIIPDLTLLTGHANPTLISPESCSLRMEEATRSIQELAQTSNIHLTPRVSMGHAADEIARLARRHGVDMVIAATHGGSGIKRFLVGSVTARLMKILECPLLVLPSRSKENPERVQLPLKRVLVGCDFSPGSDLAFDYALSLAQEFEAELHLVHVIKPYHNEGPFFALSDGGDMAPSHADSKEEEQKPETENPDLRRLKIQLGNRLTAMLPQESRHWCTPIVRIRQGEPYQELINYAEVHDIDLMVLGIQGHTLLERFLVGSTTDRVMGRTHCPVLAVRKLAPKA